MKTNSTGARYDQSLRRRRASLILWSLAFGLNVLPSVRADLSAPDNVLYGIIVLGTNQVTAGDTEFLVEAHRANGVPVARYQMGDLPEAGNFYKLQIKVEEIAPCRDVVAVLPGEVLEVLVVSNGVAQARQTFTVTQRGQATRLDFGTATTNSPLAGYAAWASALGLALDSQNLDADGDGISNLDEYIAGTNPTNAASRFVLMIAVGRTNTLIAFQALQAEGVGYEGSNRHYALEQRGDLRSGSWQAVPGYSDLLGANQAVSYNVPATNAPLFFRGKVWLDPLPGEQR
ncbi:MAG: thrombospondin type 3 repeat-containing protein [Verrucomicrobiota bacterium]|jgi:hypothetical protein